MVGVRRIPSTVFGSVIVKKRASRERRMISFLPQKHKFQSEMKVLLSWTADRKERILARIAGRGLFTYPRPGYIVKGKIVELA
jgi:hypothetical protein